MTYSARYKNHPCIKFITNKVQAHKIHIQLMSVRHRYTSTEKEEVHNIMYEYSTVHLIYVCMQTILISRVYAHTVYIHIQ